MKKLFLFMIIVLLNIVCFGENEKLKDLELYEFRSGGVVGEGYGGIDYILNAKNSREMLMYFKLNDYSKNSVRVPYYEGINQENKDLLLSEFFDKKNLELYFLDKNNEEKKKVFFKEFNKKKVYSILEKINENKIEGYYNLPFFREEITLFTSDKIIHKKVKFSSRNETLLSESEKELYNYLLDLFKEEIPEEFFEIRNKK